MDSDNDDADGVNANKADAEFHLCERMKRTIGTVEGWRKSIITLGLNAIV